MPLPRVLTALVAPVAAAASLSVLAVTPAAARPARPIRTLAVFDPAAAETPENLVVLGRRIVVSLAFASTVVVLDADGARRQSVHLDTAGGFIAGVALDARRHALAISVSSPDAAVAGLYEAPVHQDRLGTPVRLAALPAGAFPNGLAFDPAGTLYAADSLLGTIWRVDAAAVPGTPAEAWLTDSLLEPGAAGIPGANGIKYHRGRLYVSNTGRHTLLVTTSLRGRSAPAISVVRDDLQIDDFAFATDGSLYAALNQANQVVHTPLNPGRRGRVVVLADSTDGVHNPSAVALSGTRIYLTNAAFDGPTPPPSVQIISALDR